MKIRMRTRPNERDFRCGFGAPTRPGRINHARRRAYRFLPFVLRSIADWEYVVVPPCPRAPCSRRAPKRRANYPISRDDRCLRDFANSLACVAPAQVACSGRPCAALRINRIDVSIRAALLAAARQQAVKRRNSLPTTLDMMICRSECRVCRRFGRPGFRVTWSDGDVPGTQAGPSSENIVT
jgi:hypothetical protein